MHQTIIQIMITTKFEPNIYVVDFSDAERLYYYIKYAE